MSTKIQQNILLDCKFGTSSAERSASISAIKAFIQNRNLTPTLSDYELYLIIDEAITNAMEHGNKWNPYKQIAVVIWVGKISLNISIEDEGDGFDFKNYKSEYVQGDKLSTRGRGLALINYFCKPVWKKSGRLIELEISLDNNSKGNERAI